MESLQSGSNVLFVLLGAILVLFMHAGFAFLEVGTVREKNQVNALVRIFSDFATAATVGGFLVYGILKATLGIRLSEEEEFNGADLSIHRISASSR